jgi:hypothetical protein
MLKHDLIQMQRFCFAKCSLYEPRDQYNGVAQAKEKSSDTKKAEQLGELLWAVKQ